MSDLISREAMYKRLEEWNTNDAYDRAFFNFAMNRINEQPTVEAVPVVHGEWIVGSKPRCSVCGKSALREYDREAWLSYVPSDFCTHCGADLRKKVGYGKELRCRSIHGRL